MAAGPDVVIDTFRPGDQHAFAALNRAWLVQYSLLEPADERQLADPLGQIVAQGGQILVARDGAEVVGTCAVIPHESDVMELAKLVVAPAARGLGLGRRLVEACLDYARAHAVRRVVLVSNSQLGSAVGLYEAVGFHHRPVPAGIVYVTADVYMELDLAEQPSGAPRFTAQAELRG